MSKALTAAIEANDPEAIRQLDIDFTGYAADVFDGVAFVSN